MSNDRRRKLGDTGEDLATEHLIRRGLQLLDRNFPPGWGELDIVASDPRTIVFCEVKTRLASPSGRDPLESVHPRKRAQVPRMPGRWLAERQDRPRAADLRFDVIGITLAADGRLLRLDHLEAAF